LSAIDDFIFCLKPRCPLCRKGPLFRPWTTTVVEKCASCGAALGAHDIGDGASVFLLFILCFSIIPFAWGLELLIAPPLWVHAVLWTVVSLALIALLMPAVKAYIIMLEFRHRK
jgi:uncharacterized protein (DUF983 family)